MSSNKPTRLNPVVLVLALCGVAVGGVILIASVFIASAVRVVCSGMGGVRHVR